MSTTVNLKAQARTFEQQEQWSSALAAYERLVTESAPGEDLDVGLWNRIGDLHLRLGHANRAVEAYEQAVAAYAEAGLHNNALALCKKILRISPDRSETYLTLSRISALKGFSSDARAHLQQFLGLASRGDALENALSTILATARRNAPDAEVLQVLVEKLRENGWGDRLDGELTPEYERLRAEGFEEEAERLRRVMLGESIPASSERPSHRTVRALDADLIGSDLAAPEPLAPAADHARPDSRTADEGRREGVGTSSSDLELLEINPLDGLQTVQSDATDDDRQRPGAGTEAEASSLADLESRQELGADADLEDDSEVESLPLLTFEPELDVSSLEPLDIELTDDGAEELEDHAIEPPLALEVQGFEGGEEDAGQSDDDPSDLPLLSLDSATAHASGEYDEVAVEATESDAELEDATSGVEEIVGADSSRDGSPPLLDVADEADLPQADEPEDGQDGFIDLSSLIFEDDEPATTRFVVDSEEPTGDEDKDFAEMLATFREQVARNIDADDNSSHYDLGVAFKEMGLYAEAIAEFQTALRAGANPVATMEMLGECFIEKGQHAVAWRVLDQAVRLSGATDSELVGVLYWMGRCEETLGRGEDARECYERVLSVDIQFRDAGSRLHTLRE
jgi:tetratricopeptide (TPR) repeat protein